MKLLSLRNYYPSIMIASITKSSIAIEYTHVVIPKGYTVYFNIILQNVLRVERKLKTDTVNSSNV